jgi:hypothetical protein
VIRSFCSWLIMATIPSELATRAEFDVESNY